MRAGPYFGAKKSNRKFRVSCILFQGGLAMKRLYFSRWKTTAVLAVVAGLAAWGLSSRSVAQSSAGQVRTASTTIDRAPTWHHDPDPYDTFSGNVAVDPVRNEIVVQSPKKLIVYDRQANTPPAATLTE